MTKLPASFMPRADESKAKQPKDDLLEVVVGILASTVEDATNAPRGWRVKILATGIARARAAIEAKRTTVD